MTWTKIIRIKGEGVFQNCFICIKKRKTRITVYKYNVYSQPTLCKTINIENGILSLIGIGKLTFLVVTFFVSSPPCW